MNGTMRITIDRRGLGVVWLVLVATAIGLAVSIGLANMPTSAVTSVPVAPSVIAVDPAAVAAERFAVTHGMYQGAAAPIPTCGWSPVTTERDAVRLGLNQPGLSDIEFCAFMSASARELETIRRAWSHPVPSDGSWHTDWHNFHGRP